MIVAFLDAALRSLLLAVVVWVALRAFRIRNVLAEKGAWAMVLASALLMPVVLPLAARWRGFPAATVVVPASVQRAAPVIPMTAQAGVLPVSAAHQARPVMLIPDETPLPVSTETDRRVRLSQPENFASAAPTSSPTNPNRRTVSRSDVAVLVYLLVAAGLLSRLLYGLASTMRLWLAARPITAGCTWRLSAGLDVRTSPKISSPVTIGSGIVLPADYTEWDSEKLRIVLAHERSHIRQGDFYLQILAALYAALVWFSPLGWWLKRKLSDLAEAISDRSGLEEAANRSDYAHLLLEFAAAPRPTLGGIAMARQSTISRRIERLLNEGAFRQAFAGGRRARVAVLLVPIAMFAVTALIRVEAASQTQQKATPAQVQAWETSHSTPDASPNLVADQNQPAPSPATASQAAPVSTLPPGLLAGVPALLPALSSSPISVTLAPAPARPVSSAGAVALVSPIPPAAAHNFMAVAQTPATEATFDRTLSISGKLDLSVSTGSGNIHLTRGSSNQVRIHGVVRSNQPGNEQQVREIAANPPIEQSGNIVHIGAHHESMHNISIDYDIQAPADAALQAVSGSGNIVDEGVGENPKLSTGSGNITATGLQGGFKIETGSGDIAVDGAGEGDAKAETGSGEIDVKGVHGALKAETGSGGIKAAGTPSSPWKLETGSGSIEFSTGNAPVTLDASTGSGTISTDRQMTAQTASERHHLRGQLNGGGPEVRIETGSGDIRVH